MRRPTAADREEFLALMLASREFHVPWVYPPITPQEFDDYLLSRQDPTNDGLLICERGTERIAGVVNVNCIVRGFFQSAYLGYYIGAAYARRGYMADGMQLVIRHAFGELGLHRLEANIQPGNAASIRLVRKLGFQKEGFSSRYLKVGGEWRDHERWALRADM
jgi:[ribosomal protein S5]-alanine N-acetyltransferase